MKTKIVFALLTILTLTACGLATTSSPTETVSPTAFAFAPTTMLPTATATLEIPQQPPACTFPLAQITMEDSTPEKYTFSEPRMVKTNRYSIDVVEWLPDNQNALIMYENDLKLDGIKGYLETIELFNPEINSSQIFATRRSFGYRFPPRWNPVLNAIIYSAPNVLGLDKTTNQFIIDQQIRISYGNPDDSQALAHDLPRYYVAIKPDGSQVVYLKDVGKQIYQLYSRVVSQGSLEPEQLVPFDSEQFGHEDFPITYDMAWRPSTEQIFFYSNFSATSHTILLEINTGQSCTIDFDGWVYFARWSPNGRYLAVVKSRGPRHPTWVNYELNVLDTITGDLYKIDSAKIGPPDLALMGHIVRDLSWAPDNHHLAIIGITYYASTSPPPSIDRLYLVDILSGEVSSPFADYEFNGGAWGAGLAWSPDGSKILVSCPTEKEGRLCYIPVHVGGQ